MKNIFSFAKFLSAAAISVLSACQQFYIDTQPSGEVYLDSDVLAEYVRPAENAGNITFNISSTTPWKITKSEAAEWCEVSPASSSVSALSSEVVIRLQENTEYADRSVKLLIEGEGTEKTYEVNVLQEKKTRFTMQTIDEKFSAGGESKTFSLNCNIPWEIRSEKPWLSFDKNSGNGSGQPETITVTAAKNGGAVRTSTIYVTAGGEEQTFVVEQKGYMIEFEGVENNAVSMSYAGETIEVDVLSNVEWVAESSSEDFVVEKLDNGKFSVSAKINPLFVPRTATVRLYPQDADARGDVESVLEITQEVSFSIDPAWTGKPQVNESGNAVISTAAERARYVTKNGYGLGTYTWKFKNVNIVAPNGLLDINFYPDKGNISLHVFLGKNNKITTGGKNASTGKTLSAGFWQPDMTFSCSNDKINAMKELKLEVLPKDDKNVYIRLYINGEIISESSDRNNVWTEEPDQRMKMYFGLDDNAGSSVEIESFDIVPYEAE